MTLRFLVLSLAVGVAWVHGSMQGWNWRAKADARIGRETETVHLSSPVQIGEPVWWMHAASMAWALAGIVLIAASLYEIAGLAFAASITTSLPTAFYLYGKLGQS